jgi:hypothetical protein
MFVYGFSRAPLGRKWSTLISVGRCKVPNNCCDELGGQLHFKHAVLSDVGMGCLTADQQVHSEGVQRPNEDQRKPPLLSIGQVEWYRDAALMFESITRRQGVLSNE